MARAALEEPPQLLRRPGGGSVCHAALHCAALHCRCSPGTTGPCTAVSATPGEPALCRDSIECPTPNAHLAGAEVQREHEGGSCEGGDQQGGGGSTAVDSRTQYILLTDASSSDAGTEHCRPASNGVLKTLGAFTAHAAGSQAPDATRVTLGQMHTGLGGQYILTARWAQLLPGTVLLKYMLTRR